MEEGSAGRITSLSVGYPSETITVTGCRLRPLPAVTPVFASLSFLEPGYCAAEEGAGFGLAIVAEIVKELLEVV
jgi:hypothetical protein